MFNNFISEKNRKEFNQLLQKVEKQNILITSVFQDKFKEFSEYIKKFNESEVKAINNVIRSQEFYSDINAQVFKKELNKWMKVLKEESGYEQLRVKCQKLCELT